MKTTVKVRIEQSEFNEALENLYKPDHVSVDVIVKAFLDECAVISDKRINQISLSGNYNGRPSSLSDKDVQLIKAVALRQHDGEWIDAEELTQIAAKIGKSTRSVRRYLDAANRDICDKA